MAGFWSPALAVAVPAANSLARRRHACHYQVIQCSAPPFNLRCDIFRRRRTNRPSFRKRTPNVEHVCNIDIEQWRKCFHFRNRNLIERNFILHRVRDKFSDNLVRLAKRRSLLHQILRQIGRRKDLGRLRAASMRGRLIFISCNIAENSSSAARTVSTESKSASLSSCISRL